MKGPVCPLRLALYGRPDSGGFWERHCDEVVRRQGFVPIPSWKSCYFHPELKLMLSIYVDDFKMAGPLHAQERGWALIRQGLKIGSDEPLGFYLGRIY